MRPPGSSHTSFAKAKQASDEFAAVQSLVAQGASEQSIGAASETAPFVREQRSRPALPLHVQTGRPRGRDMRSRFVV